MPVPSLRSLLALALVAAVARAHMLMANPKPYAGSSTSPLAPDGSNFPCQQKSGLTGPTSSSWAAGSNIDFKLSGTACHGGGSCQWSLSYDGGETWIVIMSQIGGCPIQGQQGGGGGGQGQCQLSYSIPLPKDAPTGKAIFSWIWYNTLGGTRETYMHCSNIEVTGGGGGFTAPAMCEANLGSLSGSCKSPESGYMIFPNPGNVVVYGGGVPQGGTPQPGCDQPNVSVSQDGKMSGGSSGNQLANQVSNQAAASASVSGVAASDGNEHDPGHSSAAQQQQQQQQSQTGGAAAPAGTGYSSTTTATQTVTQQQAQDAARAKQNQCSNQGFFRRSITRKRKKRGLHDTQINHSMLFMRGWLDPINSFLDRKLK